MKSFRWIKTLFVVHSRLSPFVLLQTKFHDICTIKLRFRIKFAVSVDDKLVKQEFKDEKVENSKRWELVANRVGGPHYRGVWNHNRDILHDQIYMYPRDQPNNAQLSPQRQHVCKISVQTPQLSPLCATQHTDRNQLSRQLWGSVLKSQATIDCSALPPELLPVSYKPKMERSSSLAESNVTQLEEIITSKVIRKALT